MSAGSQRTGLLVMFGSVDAIVPAARTLRAAGYDRLDAFTPFPVPDLADAVGAGQCGRRIRLIMLIGALVGGLGGLFLQWYSAVIAYPFNVGGRPLDSWPSFGLVTFELAILVAALSGFFGMLVLNRLPQPHHPLFDCAHFVLESRNKFFLLLDGPGRQHDFTQARDMLPRLAPERIDEVRT